MKTLMIPILALVLMICPIAYASQQTATQQITITITSKLTITTLTLPNLVVGQSYTGQIGATGGTLPYTYSVNPASVNPLPAGLTLNTSTGAITGTVTSLPSSCIQGQTCTIKVTFDVVDSTP